MAKFLLLIDNYVNSRGNGTFNNIIYNENLNKVLSSYKNYRELSDNEVKKITDFVHNFYATDGENCNIHELDSMHIRTMILDDDDVCVPGTTQSFLFEIIKRDKTTELFAVERNIGGYSIDMYMEDLPYDSVKFKSQTYSHGTHLGYNMTDGAKYKTQQVKCIYQDQTFDIINTYQIYCLL